MKLLIDEIEASALKVIMLESDDLTGLANLHSQFENIASLASQTACDQPQSLQIIQTAAEKAAELIEHIILNETANAEESLKAIEETAKALQDMARFVTGNQKPAAIHFPPLLGMEAMEMAPASPAGTASPKKFELPENVDEEIFREFLANFPHELDQLESAILAAEKDPTKDNRNSIKGILHNMKGESSLMGLNEMAAVCHEAESLLIDSQGPFSGEKLLAAKDWLQNAIHELTGASRIDSPAAPTPQPIPPAGPAGPASIPIIAAAAENQENADDLIIAESDIPLVTDFIHESSEHLDNAEAELLNIEEKPEDPERINSIFRAFHTIKGVAGFLNLRQIGALAHAAENLLDLARKGNLTLEGGCIDVVFESVDVMKRMLTGLCAAIEHNAAVKPYQLLADLIERIKICSTGEKPKKRLGEVLVEQGVVSSETIRDALKTQRGKDNTEKLGDILLEKGIVTEGQIQDAIELQNQTPEPARNNRGKDDKISEIPEARQQKKIATDSTVKVTTERLDFMINMVGELVIAQSMVSQDLGDLVKSNQRLERNSRHLEKLTRDLQELSMSMRMVPVQGVFQKMARLVRDLSHKAGKEIEFQMIGAETELDRNVVEAIADPLVHMIRNSLDHGIEPPQERAGKGKSRTGDIALKACHKGGNIVVQITDDGRGLDRDKILAKAIAQGLVKEGAEISDQDVYRLIFHAGLSTAETITSISGRGVGMDVVRKNIDSLHGRIDIETTLGQGTTFTIYLPLTLAVIDGQEVTVGKEHYIIPIISIEQNFRPTPQQISTVQGGRGEMVMVRGRLLPLVRLYNLFRGQPDHTDPCQSLIVIVTDGEQRCGLQVDSLQGQQQVVIKNLGEYMGGIQGISGGAIMGNGNVSLILDIPGLIQLAGKYGGNREAGAA